MNVLAAVAPDSIATPHVDWLAIAPESSRSAARRCSSCCCARCCAAARAVDAGRASSLAVVGVARRRRPCSFWQWHDVRDDGPITTMAGMVRVDAFARVPRRRRRRRDRARRCCSSVGYLRRERLEAPEYLALMLLLGDAACS